MTGTWARVDLRADVTLGHGPHACHDTVLLVRADAGVGGGGPGAAAHLEPPGSLDGIYLVYTW